MSSGGSGIKQVIGFNGAPQEVQGRGTVALLGDGGKRVLVPDVLYVHGVQASLLSAGQLRGSGVQLLDAGDVTLLRAPDGSLLGRAESVKGLDLEKGGKSGMPCVSCVGGKITRHTFPYVGEEEDELLGVVHADLCGPFREAAKDGSRYLLVQKDRKTCMVRVWGCMLQYMVPQSQRGGKLAPKAHWGLHLGMSAASKGWHVLDLESNHLITTVEAVFYETMSLAGWNAWHQQEHGGRPMPYEPLPSLLPGTLEEELEEEEVVTPPGMPYVPTSVPTK
ncbi:unnamed protein product [Closterium sp. NIES-54]